MPSTLQFPEPGNLVHRVTVQDPPDGPAGTRGQVTGDFTPRGEAIGAWVQPLRGDELQRARSVFSRATHRVHIYFDPTIGTTHRLDYGGRILSIGFADNVNERNGRCWLICVEERKP